MAKPRTVACLQCGVMFTSSQWKVPKYCSRACVHAARVTSVPKHCQVCGSAYTVQPNEADASKYCSRACKNRGITLDGPGGRTKRRDGYVTLYYPKHPDADPQGRMMEHRYIAELKYGRRILASEHVHHINGVRDDNRPENLEVIAPGDHARVSVAAGVKKRRDARAELNEYRRRYGPLSEGN